jgi:hypothetical protein
VRVLSGAVLVLAIVVGSLGKSLILPAHDNEDE